MNRADLIHDIRLLSLEKEKLELENRIEELKAEQSIDEDCVWCAGPCQVVDVAAKLQKELDATRSMYRSASDERSKQRKTIDELEAKLSDMPDTIGMLNHTTNIETVILETGSLNKIKELETTIDELKDQNIKDLKELYDLDKSDYAIMSQNYQNTIAKLLGDIEDLNTRLIEKQAIIDKITHLRANEVETLYALKAELSARKQDSEVLEKVIEIIKDESVNNNRAANLIANVVGYYDAPEGPPETPIEEDQDIAIMFTFGEIL